MLFTAPAGCRVTVTTKAAKVFTVPSDKFTTDGRSIMLTTEHTPRYRSVDVLAWVDVDSITFVRDDAPRPVPVPNPRPAKPGGGFEYRPGCGCAFCGPVLGTRAVPAVKVGP